MYKDGQLTYDIIGLAMNVHKILGPGFKENIYQDALIKEIVNNGFYVECEKEFVVFYKGEKVGKFRVDLFVENKLVIELKAVSGEIPKLFQTQVISYLKASNKEVGLLINFGNTSLEVKRFGNYKNYSKNSGLQLV
ncbi:MAG: GxxExxY protein [Candidatus Magasanikbacteria bacterium]